MLRRRLLGTNDGLETGGLLSGGCGDSSAEREFPSDKVYSRDDRGIVGIDFLSLRALRSSSSRPALDVRPVVTLPSRHRWLAPGKRGRPEHPVQMRTGANWFLWSRVQRVSVNAEQGK
jgi:hypothetical protein